MLRLFWYSYFVGFCLAIPLGPIAFLCIHRSLHRGIKLGLLTGAGAAVADGLFGGIAGIGLTFVVDFLHAHQTIISLCGGLFLLLLGFKTLYNPLKPELVDVISKKQLTYAFITGFFLTLANPITLLAFTAVLASLGVIMHANPYINVGMLVSGFVGGSFTWWLVLCSIVVFIFVDKMTFKTLTIINRSAGYVFIGFGIISLLSVTQLYSYSMQWLHSLVMSFNLLAA